MASLSGMYKTSLALLTDLYQLTMAYGYWKTGSADKEAVFNLTFRKNPFQGGYTLLAGLEYVLEFLRGFRFSEEDVSFLAGLQGNDGRPLFESPFLDDLRRMRFSCDVHAIPEGTVAFPQEPVIRVQGPIMQCQILETPLLNILNFQSLIATKAARICMAAQGESVLEFGLRRAQGIDGALAASRAAYIGGCSSTSNVLAGRLFGIPVRGTHAHSWVMSFDSEEESFRQYAEALPNNCVFLVDTYNTLDGVRHAISAGTWLRSQGHEMIGIRLDSGDLAYLSREARRLLDEAGFPKASIFASNDLDEHIITSLKLQGATIAVWGVGTKLVTGFDQPALGGVYKLVAVRKPGERWEYKVKLSEQAIKTSTPGILQVRRFQADSECIGDLIYDESLGIGREIVLVDPMDSTRRKRINTGTPHEDLLVPVVKSGAVIYQSPSIQDIRARSQQQLSRFHAGITRFVNPHTYPVGLEPSLHELKTQLILKARGFGHETAKG
ncbi:MAG TPA: nicotinate phosphoribosyltransferase [Candidatus Ozemobacteraceae bacterium]|nr:nicotinate phosphoribosyltransferase [Candidatus Ozemobacteraceae bacterium]